MKITTVDGLRNTSICITADSPIQFQKHFGVMYAIRLIMMLHNFSVPYIDIPRDGPDMVTYQNGFEPLHSSSVRLEISLLPLSKKLASKNIKTKGGFVVLSARNDTDTPISITTDSLKLYIANEIQSINVTDEPHFIIQLRPKESLSFKGTINFASSEFAHGACILTPSFDYSDEKCEMTMTVESRGYYTVNEILNLSLKYLVESLEKFVEALTTDITPNEPKTIVIHDVDIAFVAITNAVHQLINTIPTVVFQYDEYDRGRRQQTCHIVMTDVDKSIAQIKKELTEAMLYSR